MAEGRWFYEPLPPSRFAIQERLRQTYWRAGLSTLWLECRDEKPPYRVEGHWNDVSFTIEWGSADWLLLRSNKDAARLAQVTELLLGFKPLARYVQGGQIVYEWRVRSRRERLAELRADQALENVETLDRVRS